MDSLPLFGNQRPAFEQVKRSMASIGYLDELFVENYEYQDLNTKKNKLNTIDAVGFAQTPTSYRTACIGIIIENGWRGASAVKFHRAVGSPMCFEITDTSLKRWKVTEGEPELLGTVSHSEIENLFEAKREEWSPESIFRAKSIGRVESSIIQPDFFDTGHFIALENQYPEKYDRLLRETLNKIVTTYEELHHNQPLKVKDIFRLVFRYVVAKVMLDRGHLANVNTRDPFVVLDHVENYYGLVDKPILADDRFREKIIEVAWNAISTGINFNNFSVDDLAFIYERSLIEKIDRKRLGIHSTPPRISEYIVNKLPFESIPEADRYVLEPCAGHGGFLIAACND